MQPALHALNVQVKGQPSLRGEPDRGAGLAGRREGAVARKGKAVLREGTAPALVGAPHSPGPWAEPTAAATSRRSPGLSPLPRHAGPARPRLHRALSLPPPRPRGSQSETSILERRDGAEDFCDVPSPSSRRSLKNAGQSAPQPELEMGGPGPFLAPPRHEDEDLRFVSPPCSPLLPLLCVWAEPRLRIDS